MTILNYDYIKKHITTNNEKEDVLYRWSHGATNKHLGDGILIYSLIQFHKYKTLVCLGSGGGRTSCWCKLSKGQSEASIHLVLKTPN